MFTEELKFARQLSIWAIFSRFSQKIFSGAYLLKESAWLKSKIYHSFQFNNSRKLHSLTKLVSRSSKPPIHLSYKTTISLGCL